MSPDLNYEDVTLIWLDENINENFDCLDTKCRLCTIVNYFKVFDNVQETVDYVQSALHEHLFLIVSGSLGETVLSCIHNEFQLKFIFVFCMNKEKHSEWTYKYEKICGIFIDKYELFHNLTAKVRIYEKSLLTISIFNRSYTTGEEHSIRDYTIEENVNLMWLEAFINILLDVPLDKNVAKQDMIAECRLYYTNNPAELKKIDEFENNYCPETVINWYTRDSFVYRLVNKALRMLNIDIIFKFRFLIIDLYQQLKQCHIDYMKSLSTIDPNKVIHTVYRCQHIGTHELEKLKASIGNMICPNSFFSTTEDCLMAQSFVAGSSSSECVIFQIDIPDSYYQNAVDTSNYICPFLKIENLSQFQSESEVIFSLGALFRIESVEKYNMWFVCLKFEDGNDELIKDFYQTDKLENQTYDWQSRCSVEDRILLLTEKFPLSSRNIINIYIKYGVFADVDGLTTAKTLTTYRKGFELLMKCLPDYHYALTIAMQLSIGLLYCNRGERFLAIQFGEEALHVAETYLQIDHECSLICYNYLAVIHQIEDQYTESLSIYEKMLSIAKEHDNSSALLAIYFDINRITCDFGDYEYEMVSLKKMVELERKLGCENLENNYYQFGSYYERQENFTIALYYYKEHFQCLLKKHACLIDLLRSYSRIGKMYEKYNHYIAALQIYIRVLLAEPITLISYGCSLLRKYEKMIKLIQRLIKCKSLKKVKYYFRLLMTQSFSSIIFINFVKKIKFLFYFKFDHINSLKASLNIILTQALTEYNNQRIYEKTLKDLQRQFQQVMEVKSSCFGKTYHNAQILRRLQSTLNDCQRLLRLTQRVYFSFSYFDRDKPRRNYSSIDQCSTDIGRVIDAFICSSHTTQCQDRTRQKPHHHHRSKWTYQYRFCGCFKDNSRVLCSRSTRRWAKFCRI
ncbi:unnamed protein product [Rotaria sp. Silwood2]|nr:unnamed protein product [Rotaria sp. Silwood2]CAF4556399.1 unnamed protein product [Rotaria sp. Silwood2]